jgi:NAD(P)-dependent dehydrogenase (short-subunit alcohol dehydrogenase family)
VPPDTDHVASRGFACARGVEFHKILTMSSTPYDVDPRATPNGHAGSRRSAKAGLSMFTEVAALEFGLRGVRINAAAPISCALR